MGTGVYANSVSPLHFILFIWLRWVLVVAHGIFFYLWPVNSELWHVESSSLTKNGNQGPCIGNIES